MKRVALFGAGVVVGIGIGLGLVLIVFDRLMRASERMG